MLEYWNDGKMGSRKFRLVLIIGEGLEKPIKNESNPFKTNIPVFHHSIIKVEQSADLFSIASSQKLD